MKQLVSLDVTVSVTLYVETPNGIDDGMIQSILEDMNCNFDSSRDNVSVQGVDPWDYRINKIKDIEE